MTISLAYYRKGDSVFYRWGGSLKIDNGKAKLSGLFKTVYEFDIVNTVMTDGVEAINKSVTLSDGKKEAELIVTEREYKKLVSVFRK